MAEPNILVRFLQRCFIGGGRTVGPGDQAEIPASHFHPDLHEKIGEPAAAPAPEVPSAPDSSSGAQPASPSDPSTAAPSSDSTTAQVPSESSGTTQEESATTA